jgi:hypothetical protein
MRTHEYLDKRSLVMHQLIAEKIRHNPKLFQKVQMTLERWQPIVSPDSQPYLEEWRRFAEQGMEACLAVATDESEYATTLRQSSPFCGILTNRERFIFLKSWKQDHEAQ